MGELKVGGHPKSCIFIQLSALIGCLVALSIVIPLVLSLGSAWTGLVLLIVGILGAAWIASRVSRPLRKLTTLAERVAEGNLEARSEVHHSPDELGVLASTLDDMTAALLKSTRKLEEHLTSREDTIAERTAKLKVTIAELEESRRRADAAVTAKSQFLANMSHEIRTPLNGIIGMTELTLSTELTADQTENLQLVREAAGNLLDLLNDILDVSNLEAGKLKLKQERFNIHECITGALRSLSVRAHEKGLELIEQVSRDVPVILTGDPARVCQILLNVVGNAIKFTERGEVSLHAHLEDLTGKETLVHFQVRDTGVGISEDKLKGIFELFVQGDGSMSRQYEGTGLGLSISWHLTQLMGGAMWVDSGLGKGSVFHFSLRFGFPGNSHRGASSSEKRLKGVRATILAATPTMRDVLADMISRLGMEPTTVERLEDVRAVVERAREEGNPFELAVLDFPAGGSYPVEAFLEILKDPLLEGMGCVVTTSPSSTPNTLREALETGTWTRLSKPFVEEKLTGIVLELLKDRGPEVPGVSEEQPRVGVGSAPATLRILVAEDNPVNQRVVQGVLRKEGYRAKLVTNGQEALDSLRVQEFDLILMDLQMPVLGGLEATAAIRQEEKSTGRHIPIVALTAHALDGDREKCLEAGMDGYIAKPIVFDLLIQEIKRLTGQKIPS